MHVQYFITIYPCFKFKLYCFCKVKGVNLNPTKTVKKRVMAKVRDNKSIGVYDMYRNYITVWL